MGVEPTLVAWEARSLVRSIARLGHIAKIANVRFPQARQAASGRTAPIGKINIKSFPTTKEPFMDTVTNTEGRAKPWNKGRLLGQRLPLKLKEIWAIRIRLQLLIIA